MDLGSMYLDLIRRGHDVRVFVGDPDAAAGTMDGLVATTADWRPELDWIRAAGGDGFVLFETAAHGPLQDQLRADGFQVIGGSAYGDRLETDRAFGQSVMRQAGMRVAATHDFAEFEAAIAFVRAHPRRYVYKPSGSGLASNRTFVAEMSDGRDLVAYLDLQRRSWPAGQPVSLVLMNRLDGVEVGVGAYFDGERFLQPACLDWEHKRFFPGDLGELTGEMGTLVTYRGAEAIFAETLGRMQDSLRAGRYRGYVNINTIIDDEGVHPLELTCRFGYPGFAILQPLQLCGWEELFRRMVRPRSDAGYAAPFRSAADYAIGVVLTVPPFPYATGYDRLSKGLPILLHDDLTEEDRAHLHYGEMALVGGQLVTSGSVGYVMVVTGCGATPADARAAAYRRIAGVCVPNGRYRRDIGERFIDHDAARLRAWGWLPTTGADR
jgi:phosphoribosylamine--glycine ligase